MRFARHDIRLRISMTNKIKIDIVSDVVCPWCIIGYKHLEQAISELDLTNKIDIEWQPFELNPDMPPEGENLRAHSARKYGTTPEGSIKARANITEQARKAGFEFAYYDDMKMVNTRAVHVLLEYAKQYNKQHDLKMRLFKAFFSDQRDISDQNILHSILEEVGLDAQKALEQIDNPEKIKEVVNIESMWQQMGISSVPTVVFNRTSAVNGAHPVDTFKQILTELVEE